MNFSYRFFSKNVFVPGGKVKVNFGTQNVPNFRANYSEPDFFVWAKFEIRLQKVIILYVFLNVKERFLSRKIGEIWAG